MLIVINLQEAKSKAKAKANAVKTEHTDAEKTEHKAVMKAKYTNYKHQMKSLIPGVFIDADIDEEKAVKKVVKDVSSDSEEDVFS